MELHFPPATQQTTITTTTTTTLHFPPLILPAHSNSTEQEEEEELLLHTQHPLENTPIPPEWSQRGIPLLSNNLARFLPNPSTPSKKRLSCSHWQAQSHHCSPSQSKKIKLNHSSKTEPHNPQNTSTHDSKNDLTSTHVHPLQSPNAQLELTTALSLPSLSKEFSKLSVAMQQYTLFNLLKLSKLPTLQFVQTMIEPALKRDFISDLPLEISVLVLNKLNGPMLCLASQVSKTWYNIIQSSRSIWKHRLMVEDLWIGDGSEEGDAEECELIQQSTTLPPNGVPFEMNRFSRLWKAGTWNNVRNLDPSHQRCPPPPKQPKPSSSAPKLDDDQIHPSPKDNPFNPSTQASSSQAASPTTSHEHINLKRKTELLPGDRFKLLYRKRFLTRSNWMNKEPKRISFPGHALTVVTCIQFDWFRIVAASDDHVVHSYSLKTGRRLQSFVGHQGGIWALQFVGDTLVTGSTDRTVRVWDMKTGRNTHVFHGHTSTVRCLQIVEPINLNPNYPPSRSSSDHRDHEEPIWEPAYPVIVTGSRDYTLRVWKLPSASDEEFIGYPTPGSPDESAGVGTMTPAESNTQNPFHLHFLQGHHHAVRALAAKGRTMVSGSYDCTVRSWDIVTGECKQIMTGHQQKIYSVVLDETRGRCASGSMDNTVRLWDLETGNTIKILGEHSSLVGLLGLSPTRLVSAAADATLQVYEPSSGTCKFELKGHLGAITCFVHDEFRVVSGADGTLKLWNNTNGSFVSDLLTGYSAIWQVSMDERFCVVAVQRGVGGSEYVVLDYGRTDALLDPSSTTTSNLLPISSNGIDGNLNRGVNQLTNNSRPDPLDNHPFLIPPDNHVHP